MSEGGSQVVVRGGIDPIPLSFSNFVAFGKERVATKTDLVIKQITIIPSGQLNGEQISRLVARIEEMIRDRARTATSWYVLENWLSEKATAIMVGGHMWPRHLTEFVRTKI